MNTGAPRRKAGSFAYVAKAASFGAKDPPMTAVRLEQVTKTFGSHIAVNDLSLEVPAGTIYGFIGPNGSGKTTTLRMIMHILHPDCGEIEVLGEQSTRAANDRI